MRTRFIRNVVTAALLLTGSTHSVLFASETGRESELADVFVTATRTEQSIGKLGGSSVTLLSEEEIGAKHKINASEVLKGIPGIDVIRTGSMGTTTHVFMRGADSKNTLLLVDGMVFNDPSSPNRGANFENITTDAIERIEVVRGPMSVLYGSNATGGVINIITKKGTQKPSFFAGVEGGSYNTWKYNAGVQGAVDRFDFSLIGSLIDTDGFSIANADNHSIPHAGNTSEKDGWENKNLYGKFGLDVTPDFDITTNFLMLNSRVDLDDWGPGYAGDRFVSDPVEWWNSVPDPTGPKGFKTTSDHAGGKINLHNFFFDRGFESLLSFQTVKHSARDYDNNGDFNARTIGRSREWSWQGGFDIKKTHLIDFGINHFTEELDQESTWEIIRDKTAITRSLWLQDQVFLADNFELTAGIRMDDHEEFGGKATYRLAPAYHLNHTTFKASYGTGFRSPSLYELYSDSGNENLDPEKSRGWDVGVEQAFTSYNATAGVGYFYTVYEDRIGWDADLITPQTPWGAYNQLDGKTTTKGVELFTSCKILPELQFSVDYTYTDTEDPDGKRLVRRPYNKVHVNSRYEFSEKGLINVDAFWVDERDSITSAMDESGNPVKNLDAYTLVNISAEYSLSTNVKVYARADNLFDEFYEEAWSYSTPGRSGFMGVKLTY